MCENLLNEVDEEIELNDFESENEIIIDNIVDDPAVLGYSTNFTANKPMGNIFQRRVQHSEPPPENVEDKEEPLERKKPRNRRKRKKK